MKALWGRLLIFERVVQNNDIFARGDCMKEHNEIPTLISKRLILRPFALSDSKQVQRQAGNPSVVQIGVLFAKNPIGVGDGEPVGVADGVFV